MIDGNPIVPEILSWRALVGQDTEERDVGAVVVDIAMTHFDITPWKPGFHFSVVVPSSAETVLIAFTPKAQVEEENYEVVWSLDWGSDQETSLMTCNY